MARLRLTTKQVNRGYYKGNRTGSMGFFLKSSTYIIDPSKLRTYVVPENLDSFKVSQLLNYSLSPCTDSLQAHSFRYEIIPPNTNQVH